MKLSTFSALLVCSLCLPFTSALAEQSSIEDNYYRVWDVYSRAQPLDGSVGPSGGTKTNLVKLCDDDRYERRGRLESSETTSVTTDRTGSETYERDEIRSGDQRRNDISGRVRP